MSYIIFQQFMKIYKKLSKMLRKKACGAEKSSVAQLMFTKSLTDSLICSVGLLNPSLGSCCHLLLLEVAQI